MRLLQKIILASGFSLVAVNAFAQLEFNLVIWPFAPEQGQTITLVAQIKNSYEQNLSQVRVEEISATSENLVSLLSKVPDQALILEPGQLGYFTYTFSAVACGTFRFSASASGYHQDNLTVTSQVTFSAYVNIDCVATPTPGLTPEDNQQGLYPATAVIKGNLFRPLEGQQAILEYSLSYDSEIVISIYDRNGFKLREFKNNRTAGIWQELWDGRDERGVAVAAGIYAVHFRAKGLNKSVKVAVIK
jgi:hypothetical protein